MLDHVVDKPHITIDEIVPGAGLLPQAAVNQLAVNISQGHGDCPLSQKKARDDGGAALELIPCLKLYNCITAMSSGNLA